MTKHILLSMLFAASMAYASIQELVPKLSAADLKTQTQAQLDLLATCSNAGRPGAEDERQAVCLEMCSALKKQQPPAAASQLLRNLQRIGGAETVPTLVAMYGSTDPHVADDARQALAVNPSPEAGQALLARLKMRRARSARENAGLFEALAERKEAGASTLIAPYIGNKDPLVFTAAVKALSRLDEPDGIRALARQRAKESGARKAMIDQALFETDRSDVFERLFAESEPDDLRAVALLGLTINNGPQVAEAAMDSGNLALQTAVIEAASQCKDSKLYDGVAANLDSLPSALQVQAIGVLQFSGERAYAKAVEPYLESNDAALQDAAAQALACIGTADSVPALLASGRADSRNALGLLNADGVDAILEAQAAKKGDNARRAAAIDALAMRGRQDLMPQFFKYAADSDQTVAKAAIAAIGKIGNGSSLEPLTQLMMAREGTPITRDTLRSIVEIMRRSPEQDLAVNILVAQMKGASPRSQAAVLQALSQVGSKEALEPVLAACKSNDAALQKVAVKLLGGWPDPIAIPAILELAGHDSTSLGNHVLLMRGVSRLLAGEMELDEPLAIEALETCRRPEEKRSILGSFSKADSPEARKAVEACLPDPELAPEAEAVLKKMPKAKKK